MTQPKDPQEPKILGYLHWQIGDDWATYHAIKPRAEFGITSNIEPLVSLYDFQALQTKLEKAEAENKRFREALDWISKQNIALEDTASDLEKLCNIMSKKAYLSLQALKGKGE